MLLKVEISRIEKQISSLKANLTSSSTSKDDEIQNHDESLAILREAFALKQEVSRLTECLRKSESEEQS